ncbi:hypothetical protein L6303_00730 [archaeon]|nr:hypothetical protein [Nanoarchaeota archaeon]MBU4300903.1 hypothetical protein [Nanoarchaeota archaeon]MBU4451187.1 hypothetical protein [Nanoarchaeota archaeon]MCG2723250.1 hypothetical protein [archaeon]
MVTKFIIIKEIKQPREENVENEIEWLCESFGFANKRDKNKTAMRIFEIMLQAAHKDMALSSDDIAEKAKIARSTAIHHMDRYQQSGIIVKTDQGYELRMRNVEDTIEEMELDMLRMIARMRRIAKEIDEGMGL